jgi:fido (protein-threonine AMPylation protein)
LAEVSGIRFLAGCAQVFWQSFFEPAGRLRLATRHKANPLPVVFLPGGTVRVPLAALERWIAEEDEAARRGGAC